ncbi:hypothetical protein HMPREF1529_02312 [Microbacterium sp. oral taxon 186 str. F0373]|nr:hypothetical protein HMPREF1529_02312 [Microbacterium sp. oral taxon 186 str. F0373]
MMRAGRLVGLLAVAVAVAASLSACTSPAKGTAESVSGTVGEAGIELHLEGVTVTAGADVAPSGTTMTLTSDTRAQEDLGEYATALSGGVSITLGDGLQPASPISISFDVGRDLQAGVDVDGTVVPNIFALSSQTAAGDWVAPTIAQADLNTGIVSAQVTHLSWFSPISVAIGEAWKAVKQSMGIETARPECATDRPKLNGVEVDGQPWNAWVCLVADGSGVSVELTSNANLPFIFLTRPAATVTTHPEVSFSAIGTQAFFDVLRPDKADLLLQGGSVTLDFGGATPDRISMRQDGGLSVIRILLDVAGAFTPAKAAQSLLMDKFGQLECFAKLAQTGLSVSASVEQVASFTGAFFSCASAALGDFPGVSTILWVLGAAPGSVVAMVQGALNLVTGLNETQVVFLSSASAKPEVNCEQMNAAAYQRGVRTAELHSEIPPFIHGTTDGMLQFAGGPLATATMRKAVRVNACAYPTSFESAITQWNAQLNPADMKALVDGLRSSADYAESTRGNALVFTAVIPGEDNGIMSGYARSFTYAFVGETWVALSAVEDTLPYLDSALAGIR